MRLILLGGGGHASDVLGLIEDLARLSDIQLNVVAIADDHWNRKDRFQDRNVKLILGIKNSYKLGTHFIATVGYSVGRRNVAKAAVDEGLDTCIPLIHPTANIRPTVDVGNGSIILGLSSISPRAKIGEHCYISHGALIGHDTEVGDFTSVMPGASISGDVMIGEGTLIGAGAVILEGRTIGKNASVGAGAVVVKDVYAGELVTGVPAKPKKP